MDHSAIRTRLVLLLAGVLASPACTRGAVSGDGGGADAVARADWRRESTFEPCLSPGQQYGADSAVKTCCFGFKGTLVKPRDGKGGCVASPGTFVCATCGDGKCTPGETPCTCPEDCKCIVEEELFIGYGMGSDDSEMCCPGLVAIPELRRNASGKCEPAHACLCSRCTRCGDGTCAGVENSCSCPQDCGP